MLLCFVRCQLPREGQLIVEDWSILLHILTPHRMQATRSPVGCLRLVSVSGGSVLGNISLGC